MTGPVLTERMTRHGFVDRPCRTVAGAAAHAVAIQAQDLGQARLGVRARATGLTEADVTAAIEHRSVVRTWLMRSTIHLVAADDMRWLVRLLGPTIRRRSAKRWAELGLSTELLSRAEALASRVLADGPLTRHEVADGLRGHGLDIDEGAAATHVLVFLATTGLTCHADGTRFALVEQWLPDAPAGPVGDEALAELARRYFAAFSPATAADFTAWSGLPSGRALAMVRGELVPVQVNGRAGYRLGDERACGAVRLLSGFDNFLVGYRDRAGLVPEQRRHEIYHGGIIRPTVVQDGAVVGRWRLDRAAGRVEVTYFGRASGSLRAAVEEEVADIAGFVGRPLELSVGT